jgi:hypothetical protein
MGRQVVGRAGCYVMSVPGVMMVAQGEVGSCWDVEADEDYQDIKVPTVGSTFGVYGYYSYRLKRRHPTNNYMVGRIIIDIRQGDFEYIISNIIATLQRAHLTVIAAFFL